MAKNVQVVFPGSDVCAEGESDTLFRAAKATPGMVKSIYCEMWAGRQYESVTMWEPSLSGWL